MTSEAEFPEHSSLSFDESFMKIAFDEAERALSEGEVPVGLKLLRIVKNKQTSYPSIMMPMKI